jgi:hypothetical protein
MIPLYVTPGIASYLSFDIPLLAATIFVSNSTSSKPQYSLGVFRLFSA